MQKIRIVLLAWVAAVGCQTWQPLSSWEPGVRVATDAPEVRVHFKKFVSWRDSSALLENPIVRPDSIIGYAPKSNLRLAFPVEIVDNIYVQRHSSNATAFNVLMLGALASVAVLLVAVLAGTVTLINSASK